LPVRAEGLGMSADTCDTCAMPLIDQQDIVFASSPGRPYTESLAELKRQLESYPPCRIVSIATHTQLGSTVVTAVIETI